MLVPAWRVLAILISTPVVAIIFSAFAGSILDPDWTNLVTRMVSWTWLVVWLTVLVRQYQVDLPILFGPLPDRSDLLRCVGIGLLLVAVSIAAYCLVYYLLLAFAPDYVELWLGDGSGMLIRYRGSFPVTKNTVHFLQLVFMIPFVEEVLFRGFLLRRLARRWGPAAGLWITSLLFGLLHPEVLGTVVFSFVVGVLYLGTRSLWIPIAVHSAHNAVVWLWGLVYEFGDPFSVQQEQLVVFLVAVLGLVIGVPWLIYFFRQNRISELARP